MGNGQKKLCVCVAISVFLIAGLLTGCGGGGGGGIASSIAPATTVITGTVSAPTSVASLGRAAGRAAGAVSGLTSRASLTVSLYRIDNSGATSTAALATATSNGSGVFSLTLPSGTTASSTLVVWVGSGSNKMRAFVTGDSININPLTELVVSQVANGNSQLAGFTTTQLSNIQTQVNTDAASANLNMDAASVATAVAAAYIGALKTNIDAAIVSAGGTTTWTASLTASKTGGATVGSTVYKSSTQLLVGWTAPSRTLDHYAVTYTDSVKSTAATASVAASATSTTLTGLKSATQYTVTIQGCLDASCAYSLTATSTTASATTEEEYWQLQGSSSSDSFNSMTKIVSDGNTKAYALRYGSYSSMTGKVRLYYDAMAPNKGMNVALNSGVATADPSSANSFTSLGTSAGLFGPSSGTTLIGGALKLATFQVVPLSTALGSKMRVFLEAEGLDGKTRIMSFEGQDGYTGEDFNAGSGTVCNSYTDYFTGGGCVPSLVVGVSGDTSLDSGMTNARQFKIGFPLLSSWTWDGAAGTFMVITAERTCNSPESGLAYASWDGSSSWAVEKSSSCPKYIVDNAHGPVVAHLGGAKYKLYYEDTSAGKSDKPLKMIYSDGALAGTASTVDFSDWEPASSARNVNFLWPSGNALSASSESGLGDHYIIMPTGDTSAQFMYMNLGGFDDPTWNTAPAGLGMAALLNP